MDDEVLKELEFHIEERVAHLIADGVPPGEAQRRARLEFGGISQVREACADVQRWRVFDELRDDLRFALRLARRTPGLTLTTIVALTLGLAATTTIFAVVNSVLFKPLPYANPSNLTMVWSSSPRTGGGVNTISPADYLDLARENQTLERMEGYFSFLSTVEVAISDRTEAANAMVVTPGMFDLLGRTASLGRTLRTGAQGDEIVLSDGYWRRRFGADPDVVGRSMRLGAQVVTIVGVMPPTFVFPYPGMLGPSGFTRDTAVDFWAALTFTGPAALEQRTVDGNGTIPRGVRWFGALGRLKTGVTVDQVRDDLARIAHGLEGEHPDTNRGWGVIVQSAREQTIGGVRPALLLLFAGVGLVLLMATVNVANLLLSRSLERRHEYATRVALGAGATRMLRQSLVESLLMTTVSGAFALALSIVGIRAFRAVAPADLPRLTDISPDLTMAAVAMLLSIVAGVLIAIVPALIAVAIDPQDVLREHGRGKAGSRAQRAYRNALVVTQVGLACVLTIGAALLLRSFSSVMNVNPGFAPDGLLTWQMNIPDRLETPDARRAFYLDFFERLQRIPGVLSVGGTTRIPLGSTSVSTTLEIESRPLPPAERPEVEFRRAMGRYFETMQIPLVRGRGFQATDGPTAPPVVVVNETLARRVFGTGNPVGQRLRTGSSSPWMEVVGVIGDVRHTGLEQEPAPELYINYLQNPPVAPFIVIRTQGDPETLVAAVRDEARRIDPDLPIYSMHSMADLRSTAVAQRRFVVWMVGLLGALALVLAAIGIEGIVAVTVSERAPEMSVRLALGAEPRQLWRSVVIQAARTTCWGLALGLFLTWLAMPLIRAQLFGVRPSDPISMVTVVLLFLGVALLAAQLPARRAAAADPASVLRGV